AFTAVVIRFAAAYVNAVVARSQATVSATSRGRNTLRRAISYSIGTRRRGLKPLDLGGSGRREEDDAVPRGGRARDTCHRLRCLGDHGEDGLAAGIRLHAVGPGEGRAGERLEPRLVLRVARCRLELEMQVRPLGMAGL